MIHRSSFLEQSGGGKQSTVLKSCSYFFWSPFWDGTHLSTGCCGSVCSYLHFLEHFKGTWITLDVMSVHTLYCVLGKKCATPTFSCLHVSKPEMQQWSCFLTQLLVGTPETDMVKVLVPQHEWTSLPYFWFGTWKWEWIGSACSGFTPQECWGFSTDLSSPVCAKAWLHFYKIDCHIGRLFDPCKGGAWIVTYWFIN